MSNLCIPYFKDFIYTKEDFVTEVIIPYHHLGGVLIDDFIVDANKKIIVPYYIDPFDIELRANIIKEVLRIQEIGLDVEVMISDIEVEPISIAEFIDDFKTNDIKFFFDYQITTFAMLNAVIKRGVSSVVISGDLAFDLIQTKAICDKNKVKIRVELMRKEMIEILFDTEETSLKSFFIRPEDLDTYSKYIDVFGMSNIGSKYFLETIVKVYFVDKKWFGKLQEIIPTLPSNIDSRTLIDDFAIYRSNCGRRCLVNGTCQICERAIELGNSLEKAGLVIQHNKSI